MRTTVTVDLGPRSYPIHIGQHLLAELPELLQQADIGRQIMLVTNPNVDALYGQNLASALTQAGYKVTRTLVPDGEQAKALEQAAALYDAAFAARLDRRSAVLALGGGVVGDLAGFFAATYLRGLPFIQLPTTLLAQVDSSVGGKVAINHPGAKNIIGAFYQPRLVIADLATLTTLPKREISTGLAEVIKYGVIADGEFFVWLEENMSRLDRLEPAALAVAVEKSCRIKAQVVGRDEREQNLRAILNFGHTAGHALEAVTDYAVYRHGEAVAIGMMVAARLAVALGMMDLPQARRLQHLLQMAGLPVTLPEGIAVDSLITAMQHDKKIISGRLTFVLPASFPGHVVLQHITDTALLADVLRASYDTL
ncbi:MAG: 3-dehydroquinate synthase [Bacillota bacterium]